MSWQIPNEIWRIIIRQATIPDDVTFLGKDSDESRIARTFDPASLADQCRFPWRGEFKPPVDTVTSLRTKYSLVQVSHRFYGLSCEFLYETLYLPSCRGINDLARLYERSGHTQLTNIDGDRELDLRRWTKYIHVWSNENVDQVDIQTWAFAVMKILKHSAPRGFIQIYDFFRVPSESMSHFWQSQASMILRYVPACVQHLEWYSTGSSSWLDVHNGPVINEMLELWRRADSLRALRIEASKLSIPLDQDLILVLPRVTFLDINATCYDLSHLVFPSLLQLALPFYLQRLWTSRTIPYPSYICLDSMWSFSSGLIRNMMGDINLPCLRKLCILPDLSMTSLELDKWVGINHHFLRCIELHIARPGRWLAFRSAGYYDDVEDTLARLTQHVKSFADVCLFPSLERFELKGFRYVQVEAEEYRGELHALAFQALSELSARQIEVSVEE